MSDDKFYEAIRAARLARYGAEWPIDLEDRNFYREIVIELLRLAENDFGDTELCEDAPYSGWLAAFRHLKEIVCGQAEETETP